MPPHLTIREAASTDIAALSALARETYTAAFGHSMSAEDLATQLRDTRSESYFTAALRADAILLAFVDTALAGYIQLCGQPADDNVEINAIYVAPQMQGQGIGTALLKAAANHSRIAEARQITLDVWQENPRAVALYQRHGFTIVGQRDFKVGDRILGTDLVMRCQRLRF